MRATIGHWMRTLADIIDRPGAPKALTRLSFTFEPHMGLVIRDDKRGCPLWVLNDADYERAHSEAGGLRGEHVVWFSGKPSA